MKTTNLLITVTVLLANTFCGGAETASPLFFSPEVEDSSERNPLERNLSMRFLRERNLSMRYLSGRNLSMRYLAVGESDAWGRSLSDKEQAKLGMMAEDGMLLWQKRNLSMRYLKKDNTERVRRLRAAENS